MILFGTSTDNSSNDKLIDAGVDFDRGICYFFKDDKYISYDTVKNKPSDDYPKAIKGNWPGLDAFSDGIDAAVNLGDGTAYFFKGYACIHYSIENKKALSSPIPTYDVWTSMNPMQKGHLDAYTHDINGAIRWDNGTTDLFQKSKFTRFYTRAKKALMGFPSEIKGHFPALDAFSDGIDAAVKLSNESIYFFKGNKFIRYNIYTHRAYSGYPKTWNGSLLESNDTVNDETKEDQKQLKNKWDALANFQDMNVGESKFISFFGNDKYEVGKESVTDLFNAKSGVIVTRESAGPRYSVVAKASLINIHAGKKEIEAVDFDVLSTSTQADISSTYIGVGADLNLVSGSVSIFNAKLGIGADTVFGIKDDSFQVEVLGTGIKVGRVVGISVLGNEFEIDFGRIFSLF